MIEPVIAEVEESAQAVSSSPAQSDNPMLPWQLFFPADTQYEGVAVSPFLDERLQETSAPSARRVQVMTGRPDLRGGGQDGLSGLVLLGAKGSRKQLRNAGFEGVYRYLALPSIENPRWLLPVEQAHAAAVATLPRMYKLSSRLLRLGLIAALKFGTAPFRSRTITIATRQEPAIVGAIAALFPGRQVRLSFAAGTPGPMRKPTVVTLDREGRALAFGKVATSPVSEALVRNEALVLRAISGASKLLPLAPRLLLEASCDGRTVVVTSSIGGGPLAAKFGREQRRFFAALQADSVEPVFRNPFLARLERRVGRLEEEEAGRLLRSARLALATAELPRTLMHGDATPWNMRRKQGAIAAFDWEYGVIDGLPVLDELHYRWHTRFLLDHRPVDAILQELDAAARARSGVDEVQSRALVDVFLVHGLTHRLEMGCGEDDELVIAYREALAPRTLTMEAPR
ncbi:MAG: phosphotransferase [Dehalococcoidia bacterium]